MYVGRVGQRLIDLYLVVFFDKNMRDGSAALQLNRTDPLGRSDFTHASGHGIDGGEVRPQQKDGKKDQHGGRKRKRQGVPPPVQGDVHLMHVLHALRVYRFLALKETHDAFSPCARGASVGSASGSTT